MKKLGGIFLLLLVCVVSALVVPTMQSGIVVSASSDEELRTPVFAQFTPSGSTSTYQWRNEFIKYDTSSGIFIIKDYETAHLKTGAYFSGDLTPSAGEWTAYNAFSFTPMIFENEVWTETNLFDTTNLGSACEFRFYKRLPTGKYGVKLNPLVFGGEGGIQELVPATDEYGNEIYSIYVILYAEPLKYINCAFRTPSGATVSAYDVGEFGRGNVTFEIYTNPGAMNLDYLYEQSYYDKTTELRGNLSKTANDRMPDIRLDDLVPTIRNQDGGVVNLDLYRVRNEVTITIPSNFMSGRYSIRFEHPDVEGVYGEFVVDYRYSESYGSSGAGVIGAIIWIFGLVLFLCAVAMFVLPRVQVRFQKYGYKKVEERVYTEGADGEMQNASVEKRGFWKNLFGPPIQEKPASQGDKEGEGEETKKEQGLGRKFLQKLQDSKTRREIAREAGITMDEFKEIENRQKKLEEAQKHSLAAFRRAIDEHKNIEIVNEGKKDTDAPKLAKTEGGTEFELLDSVKQTVAVSDESFAKTVIMPNIETSMPKTNILARLTNLAADTGVPSVAITTSAHDNISNASTQDVTSKTGANDLSGREPSNEASSEKVTEGNFENPSEKAKDDNAELGAEKSMEKSTEKSAEKSADKVDKDVADKGVEGKDSAYNNKKPLKPQFSILDVIKKYSPDKPQ